MGGKKPRRRDRLGMGYFVSGTLPDGRPGILVLRRQSVLPGTPMFHLSALAARRRCLVAMAFPHFRAVGNLLPVAGAKENWTRTIGGFPIFLGNPVSGAGIYERVWNSLFIRLGSLGLFVKPGIFYLAGRVTGAVGKALAKELVVARGSRLSVAANGHLNVATMSNIQGC